MEIDWNRNQSKTAITVTHLDTFSRPSSWYHERSSWKTSESKVPPKEARITPRINLAIWKL